MKILIAGLGSIGRRHLRNLLALGESDILLYRTGKGSLSDGDLQGFPVETSLEAALAWGPQAVIIANPTALHLDVAIPAAQAGCYLLLEKPVSHSMERVDSLQTSVAQSGSRVLVGYQFRFHPGLQRLKRLLDEGAIGRPLATRAHWGEYLPGWHPWEDYRQGYSARTDLGGGVVLTLSHPLDYLRWLLGDVARLWAFTARLGNLDIGVEDTAEIGLQFTSGVLGSIHMDYNQRPPAHTLEITGTQGTLAWDNHSGDLRLYRADSQGGSWQAYPVAEAPGEHNTSAGKVPFERNHLFLAEMRHFLAMARGESQPACSLEDGVRALQLALAALSSARLGCLETL